MIDYKATLAMGKLLRKKMLEDFAEFIESAKDYDGSKDSYDGPTPYECASAMLAEHSRKTWSIARLLYWGYQVWGIDIGLWHSANANVGMCEDSMSPIPKPTESDLAEHNWFKVCA
jgi:hypothetical protein